MPVRSFRHIMF